LFLDYDGTLTPIVDDPAQAVMADAMRATAAQAAEHHTVTIVSGRDLSDLKARVGLENLYYAGSHGFDIAGPAGWGQSLQRGEEFLPELDRVEAELRSALDGIAGHAVERKRFSIAVHYRRVGEADLRGLEAALDRVLDGHPRLRKGHGKKVFQIQPGIEWDKGHAVRWLLAQLGLDRSDVVPLYIGDDLTDEDAFRALGERGVGIAVRNGSRPSAAQYSLADPDDVRRFLELLVDLGRGDA
jgi:trehalose-phosphatase